MIDYTNDIFTELANAIWKAHGKDIDIKGEYMQTVSKFPTVTIDETLNTISNRDNGNQRYANITYRVQVFTNGNNASLGRRGEARAIMKTVSDTMYSLNLMSTTYATIPNMYRSEIYEIQATFEGVIDTNGTIYRR